MQFVVKRDTLLKSLNFVQGVVEKKNTLPILSNVLLQLKDKKLSRKSFKLHALGFLSKNKVTSGFKAVSELNTNLSREASKKIAGSESIRIRNTTRSLPKISALYFFDNRNFLSFSISNIVRFFCSIPQLSKLKLEYTIII